MLQPEKIYILHLTDLHIGETGELDSTAFSAKRLNSLYNKLKSLRKIIGNAIVHVIITGDFIEQYHHSKYAETERLKLFLEEIRGAIATTPDRFVFCLGNHDIDRDEQRKLLASISEANEDMDFKEWGKRGVPISRYEKTLVDAHLGNEGACFIDPYKYIEGSVYPMFKGKSSSVVGIKAIDGVAYVVLNSSWFCGIESSKELGNLTLGLELTKKLLDELKSLGSGNKHFVIALMHHSFGSMHISNYHIVGSEKPLSSLIFENCQLMLNGHEHGELFPSMADMNSYIFRAGSTLANRDLKGYNTFSFIELDFIRRQIDKTLYGFDVNHEEGTWTELQKFTLQFPIDLKSMAIDHKVPINEYFLNLKKFILERMPSGGFYPAQQFLEDTETDQRYKLVCDLRSLQDAETLTEYLILHSQVRTRVILKIATLGLPMEFKEPLELIKTD